MLLIAQFVDSYAYLVYVQDEREQAVLDLFYSLDLISMEGTVEQLVAATILGFQMNSHQTVLVEAVHKLRDKMDGKPRPSANKVVTALLKLTETEIDAVDGCEKCTFPIPYPLVFCGWK